MIISDVLLAVKDHAIRLTAPVLAIVTRPVMEAKNDRTILSWILILMITLLGLQIVEVLIDLAQLWLG